MLVTIGRQMTFWGNNRLDSYLEGLSYVRNRGQAVGF